MSEFLIHHFLLVWILQHCVTTFWRLNGMIYEKYLAGNMADKYGFFTSSCSSSFFFFFGQIGTLARQATVNTTRSLCASQSIRARSKAISRTLVNSLGLLSMLPKLANGVWVYVATSMIIECRESCRCSVRAKTLNQGALKESMEVSAEHRICRD